MEAATVIKPEHQGSRKHLLFTDEHEDLRESMEAWVKAELYPHRNEWEETTWPERDRCAAPASWAISASASRRSTAGRAATTTTRWSAPSA